MKEEGGVLTKANSSGKDSKSKGDSFWFDWPHR